MTLNEFLGVPTDGRLSPRSRISRNQKSQNMDAISIDRELQRIRQEAEKQYPNQQLDFYVDPLVGKWADTGSSDMKQITREHVLGAIEEIDAEGIPGKAQSTFYDLLHEGRRYPPKYVLSLAAKYSRGEVLNRRDFTGGDKSKAFHHLRKLGFQIERKDLMADAITRFVAQADESTDLRTSDYPNVFQELKMNVSFGKGNYAKVPWIAFTGFGQEVQKRYLSGPSVLQVLWRLNSCSRDQ